jgi:hypothetical protein
VNKLKRVAASIGAGIVLSIAVNFIALECVWHTRAYDGLFVKLVFAVGRLLAPNGFEGQSIVVPLNVLGLAGVFSAVCFAMMAARPKESR